MVAVLETEYITYLRWAYLEHGADQIMSRLRDGVDMVTVSVVDAHLKL